MANKTMHKLYLCGVDYQHELGETGVRMYPSKKQCEKEQHCTDDCGVVELTMQLRSTRWVRKQRPVEKWKCVPLKTVARKERARKTDTVKQFATLLKKCDLKPGALRMLRVIGAADATEQEVEMAITTLVDYLVVVK
jgi:hypothetical protein